MTVAKLDGAVTYSAFSGCQNKIRCLNLKGQNGFIKIVKIYESSTGDWVPFNFCTLVRGPLNHV